VAEECRVRPPKARVNLMSALALSVLATFAVSLISFVGLFFIAARLWNDRLEVRAVSFAAGVLLASTFLDLLPEALKEAPSIPEALTVTLLAMVGFFFVERVIHSWHGHTHGEPAHPGEHPGEIHHVEHGTASRYLILLGDGVHNAIDGVAIAASFITSPAVGLTTTLAVMAHEIPHEVGDYAVLVRGGYSRKRALIYNFLSGLTAVAGAVMTFMFGEFVEHHLSWFVAATAGMFLYIAAANLIPELHHQRLRGRFLYGGPFLLGILTVAVLTSVIVE